MFINSHTVCHIKSVDRDASLHACRLTYVSPKHDSILIGIPCVYDDRHTVLYLYQANVC